MTDSQIQRLLDLEEHEVFFTLMTLFKVQGEMQMQYFESKKSSPELANELRIIDQNISLVLALLERYGINDFKLTGAGKLSLTPLGRLWYNKWKQWYDQLEARGEIETFLKLKRAGMDIVAWLPEHAHEKRKQTTDGNIGMDEA